MSYRNITVDGIEYEYSIGKTHFKVKGVGSGSCFNIGRIFDYYDEDEGEQINKVAIYPRHIEKYIKENVRQCK